VKRQSIGFRLAAWYSFVFACGLAAFSVAAWFAMRASVYHAGFGISEADMPHIFDRFWRADKARSREHGGAGLGLSIAKWIVEEHGGSIEVQSKPGKGSVFRVRIPFDHSGHNL
jgi:signal transduction histidine kinase